MHCYRLNFTAPFHIDSRGDAFHERSESFIHSDTLSAALLSAWALLEPEDIGQRAAEPPFKLSSAFPFYGQTYFLPRAISTQAVKLPAERLKEAKKLKKLQWLEISLWKESIREDWITARKQSFTIRQACLALAKPEPSFKQLWAEEQRPRLALDRITNSSSEGQLFHLSRIWFAENAGLYFLVQFCDHSVQKPFEAALKLLGDSGIGSDRSNGNGFFSIEEVTPPDVSIAGENEQAVALSLVSPGANDFKNDWLDGSAYKLISRGGWVGQTGLRKKRLRLFAEGSVFKQPLQGQVTEITPDHAPNKVSPNKVYRDGRGFFIKAG